MHSDDTSGVSPPVSRWRAYTWGVLAVLTYPCHLPFTAARCRARRHKRWAFIGDHWGVAALALTGLFTLFLVRAIRAFRGISP